MASLALVALAAAADDYEVKFDRPFAVGDRHRIVAQASESQTTARTVDGKSLPPVVEKFSASAEFLQVVERVDERGRPRQVRLTFDKLVATPGDGKEARVAPGTVIIASHDGTRATFTRADGKELALERALIQAIELLHEFDTGEISNDRIFGTAGRRRTHGEEWPMDAQATAANFAETDVEVKAEDIQGTVTLGKLVHHAALPCLEIRARLHVKSMKPPVEGLQGGLALQEASLDVEVEALLPVDTAGQPPRYTESMKTNARVTGEMGEKQMVIRIEGTRNRKVEITSAPPA